MKPCFTKMVFGTYGNQFLITNNRAVRRIKPKTMTIKKMLIEEVEIGMAVFHFPPEPYTNGYKRVTSITHHTINHGVGDVQQYVHLHLFTGETYQVLSGTEVEVEIINEDPEGSDK